MRILQNFSFLTISQAAEKLINFLIVILLAAYLGAEGYGTYALCIAFVSLFNYVIDAGLNMLTMREVASGSEDESSFLGRVLASKVLVGLAVAVLIMVSACYLYPTAEIRESILLYTLAVLLLSFSNTFRSALMAKERMELEGLLATGHRVLLIAGISLFILINVKLPGLMYVHLLSCAIILVASVIIFKKYFGNRITYDLNPTKVTSLLKRSFPFALGAIMGEIYFNVDRVMLSKFCGLEAVGYYSVAYRLCFVWIFMANSLSLAAYPVFSRTWNTDRDLVARLFNSLFKVFLIVSVPLALVVYVTAGEIVALTFGKDFYESIGLLKILVWLLPPMYLMHLTGRTLEAIGEQVFIAKSMTVGVIINVLLNLVLIPRFGAAGACVSTVVAAAIIFVVQFVYINKIVGRIRLFESIVKMLIPLLALFGVLFFLKESAWMASILLALITYLLFLYLVNTMEWKEIEILRGKVE
ncbi:MAG: flippase [Planctomycetota bacterium]